MGFSQQSLEPVELSQAERKMRTDVLMRSLTMVMLVLCPLLKWVLGKPSDVKIIRCLSCPPVAGSRQHLLVPSGYLCPFDLNGNTLYFWCPTSVRRVNSLQDLLKESTSSSGKRGHGKKASGRSAVQGVICIAFTVPCGILWVRAALPGV